MALKRCTSCGEKYEVLDMLSYDNRCNTCAEEEMYLMIKDSEVVAHGTKRQCLDWYYNNRDKEPMHMLKIESKWFFG